MKKELDYFTIENNYGGSQAWFSDFFMKIGGCAAVVACDSSIYLSKYKKIKGLIDKKDDILDDKYAFTIKEYEKFSKIMKPYLKPRVQGIDRLDIFIDGFNKYRTTNIEDKDALLELNGFNGEENEEKAVEMVKRQIDSGFIIPFLMLKHKNKTFRDYEWHWFILNGYEETEKGFFVKVVTYGDYRWLDFIKLWDTGYKKKGGMIIYSVKEGNENE